jgi:hypothetical protein
MEFHVVDSDTAYLYKVLFVYVRDGNRDISKEVLKPLSLAVENILLRNSISERTTAVVIALSLFVTDLKSVIIKLWLGNPLEIREIFYGVR